MLTKTNRNALLTCGLALLLGPACVSGEIDPSYQSNEQPGDQSLEGEGSTPQPVFLASNGAPSGNHFTLNMIGVPKGKKVDMTGGGSRMFVPLFGSTKVLLSEGDFQVLDANATDGSGSFQLPNPDPENDGITTYSVFARALGKPGGTSTTTTCAQDATGETFCSVFSLVSVRNTGPSKFTNVSRELLFLFADLDGDGTLERFNLFNDALQNFFWQYDNQGLKLLQLRFYEVPTNVN
jgi:hypothetical protein